MTKEPLQNIQLNLPANLGYLSLLGPCLTTMLEQASDIKEVRNLAYNIQLAIHEICTNIIGHAYDNNPNGRIAISMEYNPKGREVIIHLTDTGHSFDPTSVPDPDPEALQEGGYGLFLVRKLMDEMSYNALPGGNHWLLTKKI